MSRKPPTQEQQNNSRNEYIPSYISKAPFYAEGLSDGDYLEHQRLHATPKDTLDKAKWYNRGRKAGPAATKFRKGACENCGAMTHKTKDCLERPRKHGAKWTGQDIQADEVLDEVKLGWDAKRDRWNGYDAREYSAVVREYEEMEELRKATAAASKQNGDKLIENGEEEDEDSSEAKYAEEVDMSSLQPKSTRQLRLREDTAKYLVNLDLDSARYDPKTRSMDTTSQTLSSHQQGEGGKPGADTIAEEGFVRPTSTSDDAAAFERAQRYAWETQESSNPLTTAQKLHLQANPTEGELALKKRDTEQAAKKSAHRQALIDKYGGGEHLGKSSTSTSTTSISNNPNKPKAIVSTTAYVEYDKHGNPKMPAGYVKPVARSKYPEDIHPNNHTSVFGSWWASFRWGYRCCHSTVKNSYCTGEEGKLAFEQAEGLRTGQGLDLIRSGNRNDHDNIDNIDNINRGNDPNTTKVEHVNREEAQALTQQQTGEDIQERKDIENTDTSRSERERDREPQKLSNRNKRPFSDMGSGVSEEEIEAYKRNKMAASDPMRDWGQVGEDGLLER